MTNMPEYTGRNAVSSGATPSSDGPNPKSPGVWNVKPWEVEIKDFSEYSTKELADIGFAVARDEFEEVYGSDE
ncbi:MAG: hypothetical protein ABEJ72_04610, partial [Candidatus Aenigmatarchaeota archaeon]